MADTPEKNDIATPISTKCEDSPVFNFINSLSPIEPVKSINIPQTFSCIPFTSPSSVFTSPQIFSRRETRFLKRNHFINLSRPDLSEPGNEDRKTDEVSVGVESPSLSANELGCLTPGNSVSGISARTCDYHSELVIEFPKTLKYKCSSPNRSILPSNVLKMESMMEMDGTRGSLAQFMGAGSIKRHCSSENDIDTWENCQIEQSKEASTCDWEKWILDAADLLLHNSSMIESVEQQDDETFNYAISSCVPSVTQPAKDHSDDLWRNQSLVPNTSEKQQIKLQAAEAGEIANLKEADNDPEIRSNTVSKKSISDSNVEVGDKHDKEIDTIFKPGLQQHRSIRRLVFEISRGPKNRVMDNHGNSSVSLPECKFTSNEKKISIDLSNGCSSSRLPGIGLHLNGLASTLRNVTVPKNDDSAFSEQLVNLPDSHSAFDTLDSSHKAPDNSLDGNALERGSGSCDNGTQVKGDMTSSSAIAKDVNQCSPKKKRRKAEQGVEGDSCKRCNCKKSKCLKLYCDCFAAGLYCIEPCSCQDCFNKPKHADTVLQTRQQIESRNPLAFAPKVIRSSEFVQEFGDETESTPASARHKRGCNCKKSNCLKKYCECFQGGVGCSISCRCEGCKNSFGRKYGIESMELEEEEAKEYEKTAMNISSQSNIIQNVTEKHLHSVIPELPSFDIANKPPSAFQGKHLQVVPGDETHHILEGNCPTTDRVRSMSPNCKRVSPPHCKSVTSRTLESGRKLILKSIPSFPLLRHETNTSSGNHD